MKMVKKWSIFYTMIFAATALFIAQCSDDDDNPVSNGSGSIIDITGSRQNLSMFNALADTAELSEKLDTEGPYTVFVPANESFNALDSATLAALMANPDALDEVLQYHIVPGEIRSTDLENITELSTLQGGTIQITKQGDTLLLNDSVRIITANIEASNGIVHIIQGVLIPPTSKKTIAELVQAIPQLSTLATALTEAGLISTLSGTGPFTVLAPTNDAFDALPDGTLDSLLADPQGELRDILLYHVVPEALDAEAIAASDSLTTVQGSEITVDATNGSVVLNDGTRILVTGIIASNGIIHVIDKVLLP